MKVFEAIPLICQRRCLAVRCITGSFYADHRGTMTMMTVYKLF